MGRLTDPNQPHICTERESRVSQTETTNAEEVHQAMFCPIINPMKMNKIALANIGGTGMHN